MSTLRLNSTTTRGTGQYNRTLRVAVNPSAVPANQRIVPSSGTATIGLPAATTSLAVAGMWIQDSLTASNSITAPGRTFESDNTTSGVTFITLQRSDGGAYNSINLNVGPNSTGSQDYGDSVYIDSGNRRLSAITNSRIITGNEDTVPVGTPPDNDLVFFGSETSNGTLTPDTKNRYSFILGSSISAQQVSGFFSNVTGLASPQSLRIEGVTVSMGKGSDTLVFANTNVASVVRNNVFNTGTGADFVFFASLGTLRNVNTLNIGTVGGGADLDADTICFNYRAGFPNTIRTPAAPSPVPNSDFPAGSTVAIRGFGVNDRIYYNGELLSNQADIVSKSGGKISFIS